VFRSSDPVSGIPPLWLAQIFTHFFSGRAPDAHLGCRAQMSRLPDTGSAQVSPANKRGCSPRKGVPSRVCPSLRSPNSTHPFVQVSMFHIASILQSWVPLIYACSYIQLMHLMPPQWSPITPHISCHLVSSMGDTTAAQGAPHLQFYLSIPFISSNHYYRAHIHTDTKSVNL